MLELKKNPDILADVAALQNAPFTVGFAAETEDLEQNAQIKLEKKKLDIIAANRVGEKLAFDVEENALTLFWKSGTQKLEQTHKDKLARKLIAIIAERYYEKNSNQTH